MKKSDLLAKVQALGLPENSLAYRIISAKLDYLKTGEAYQFFVGADHYKIAKTSKNAFAIEKI